LCVMTAWPRSKAESRNADQQILKAIWMPRACCSEPMRHALRASSIVIDGDVADQIL